MSKELQRLIEVAKGFDCRIKIFEAPSLKNNCDGEYSAPTRSSKALIEIYRHKRYSDSFLAVILLHELGHHLDYLDSKWIPDAYLHIGNDFCPKWARKAILNTERRAIAYAERLYFALGFNYPYWKFKRECDKDLYSYKHFYKYGRWARKSDIREFYRNWDKKHKKSLASIR